MQESKISKIVNGREHVLFTCRSDKETGDGYLLFRGRKTFYPVTYEQMVEALDQMDLLGEFVRRINLAAQQRGCIVTS